MCGRVNIEGPPWAKPLRWRGRRLRAGRWRTSMVTRKLTWLRRRGCRSCAKTGPLRGSVGGSPRRSPPEQGSPPSTLGANGPWRVLSTGLGCPPIVASFPSQVLWSGGASRMDGACPHLLRSPMPGPLYLAGVGRPALSSSAPGADGGEAGGFAVLTCPARPELLWLHHREPRLLTRRRPSLTVASRRRCSPWVWPRPRPPSPWRPCPWGQRWGMRGSGIGRSSNPSAHPGSSVIPPPNLPQRPRVGCFKSRLFPCLRPSWQGRTMRRGGIAASPEEIVMSFNPLFTLLARGLVDLVEPSRMSSSWATKR